MGDDVVHLARDPPRAPRRPRAPRAGLAVLVRRQRRLVQLGGQLGAGAHDPARQPEDHAEEASGRAGRPSTNCARARERHARCTAHDHDRRRDQRPPPGHARADDVGEEQQPEEQPADLLRRGEPRPRGSRRRPPRSRSRRPARLRRMNAATPELDATSAVSQAGPTRSVERVRAHDRRDDEGEREQPVEDARVDRAAAASRARPHGQPGRRRASRRPPARPACSSPP